MINSLRRTTQNVIALLIMLVDFLRVFITVCRVTQKKRAPALIRPCFLVFGPNEMKLWSYLVYYTQNITSKH